MEHLISEHIRNSIEIRTKLLADHATTIEHGGKMIADAIKAGGKLLTCGNGGSSADAQHIAAELLIRFKAKHNRPAIPAICVSSDPCALTAAGNDFGADSIFARQILGLGSRGDVLLAITTSGNSPNIIAALRAAREKGLGTLLLTGESGGAVMQEFSDLVDLALQVPSCETAHIQEAHIMIGHLFCAIVEKQLYGLG